MGRIKKIENKKEYHKKYNQDYYQKNKDRDCYKLSNLRKLARSKK